MYYKCKYSTSQQGMGLPYLLDASPGLTGGFDVLFILCCANYSLLCC